MTAEQFERFNDLLARYERIRAQERKTKGKLYVLHAPEVECIAKGTSAFWLDMVERFFRDISENRLRRGVFTRPVAGSH